MKLFGEKPKGPNVSTLVLPRQNYDIVIMAQAIMDDAPFDLLCPRPTPPKIMKPGGVWSEDTADKNFLKILENWAEKKTSWTIIESLRATPVETLEWEEVKYEQPDTWPKWKDELRKAFFTDTEIMRIMNLVWEANGINQSVLDEARNRFLAGQARPYIKQQSLQDEQLNMQSGEPAKDLV